MLGEGYKKGTVQKKKQQQKTEMEMGRFHHGKKWIAKDPKYCEASVV